MGSYKIFWKTSARKELKKIDKNKIKSILSAVEQLADDPFPPHHKKLIGTTHYYRIRVGDYRVVYSIEKGEMHIHIIRVRHRKNVYSNLT